MTTYTPTAGDPGDVLFCTTFVEAAYLGPDSTLHYLETMRDSAIALARQAAPMGAEHARLTAIADTYADAIRVLDIAADAASRAYQRHVAAMNVPTVEVAP